MQTTRPLCGTWWAVRSLTITLYASLLIAGCVQVGEPLTEEDRCALLCQGNRSSHPCHGEVPADDCVATCADHIRPLTGECLTCVLNQSGWVGTGCECTDVDRFGMVNVECDACSYTVHQKECAASTECTRDSGTCDGFRLVEPTGPICSPVCM